MAAKFASVEDYLASLPPETRAILERVRRTIMEATPDPGEKISYQIPLITSRGEGLIYCAGWKHHIGLYPIPHDLGALQEELAPYRAKKDSLRLPYDQPIPYGLLQRLVALLVGRREDRETGPQ